MSDNVHRVVGNLLVGTSHFFVDTTTNRVGVNTSSPSASLDIATGDLKVGSGITIGNSGTITATAFDGDGSLLQNINSDSGSWVNGTSSNVHLATSTDRVGIGTPSPDFKLHVVDSDSYSVVGRVESKSATTTGTSSSAYVDVVDGGGHGGYIQGYHDPFVTHGLRLGTWTGGGRDSAKMYILSTGRVGIGTSDPGAILDVEGSDAASPIKKSASTASTGTYNFVLNGPRPGTTGSGATHFINGSTRGEDGGNNTYTIRNDSGTLRLGHASYNTILEGAGIYPSTIYLSTSSSIRQDSTTWTGNPGTQGKLEYHDRKWYVVAGSDSYELALFRRDGADKVSITNDGNFLRRSYSNGYLIGGQNNIGGTDAKTNPIYTIGTSHMPSDTGLGDMYGIGYSHGNFTSMLTSGWGLYVAADGDIRIGLNASNGIIKCTGYVDTPQIYMGSSVRQHLNLYGSTYGLGVQGATLYLRSDGNFIFYKGGSHNNSEGNAGGGTEIANFNRNGWTYLRQYVQITGYYLEQYNQRRVGTGSYPTRLEWPNSGHHVDCYYNSSGHVFHINHYAQATVYLNRSAYSDRRIKKNIKDINDTSALDTLRKLRPKTYEYKLNPEKGMVYGFIAQEVKEVLPHATNVTTLSAPFETEDFINATFEKLEDEKVTVTLENPLNPKYPIQPGINLLFKVGPNEKMDYKILEIVDDTHIIIDNDKHDLPTIQPILVGSQVNDFHGLDKDAIFTVATAALQEVDRQLQATKADLDLTKADMATLQAVNQKLEARIAFLESALIS